MSNAETLDKRRARLQATSVIDVLIAGAGPAGAVAATVLARAGARVLVLDRAQFPRPKLCGDTLNPGALAVLQRLGLGCAAAASDPARRDDRDRR